MLLNFRNTNLSHCIINIKLSLIHSYLGLTQHFTGYIVHLRFFHTVTYMFLIWIALLVSRCVFH